MNEVKCKYRPLKYPSFNLCCSVEFLDLKKKKKTLGERAYKHLVQADISSNSSPSESNESGLFLI